MQILTSDKITQALDWADGTPESNSAASLMDTLGSQVIFMEYAARMETAVELGPKIDNWLGEEEEQEDPNVNQALLATAMALLRVASYFSKSDIPPIEPNLLMAAEEEIGNQLAVLFLKPDATDKDLFKTVVEDCRQKDLLNFGLMILDFYRNKGMEPDSLPPVNLPEDEGTIEANFREIIKLRVMVDCLDTVVEDESGELESSDN